MSWNIDAGLVHIERITKRISLDLSGTGLTHLKVLAELTELGLGCPTLSRTGYPELKQLQKLSLAGSGLTDVGLQALDGLTNLRKRVLISTKVTSSGVAKLKEALPRCNVTAKD